MKKRIAALLLTLAMVVTYMPALAFAADNDAANTTSVDSQQIVEDNSVEKDVQEKEPEIVEPVKGTTTDLTFKAKSGATEVTPTKGGTAELVVAVGSKVEFTYGYSTDDHASKLYKSVDGKYKQVDGSPESSDYHTATYTINSVVAGDAGTYRAQRKNGDYRGTIKLTVVTPYEVTFNPNGGKWGASGESVKKNTGANGKVAEWPENPTKEGKFFAGWYTAEDEECTSDSVFEANTELTAKWEDGVKYVPATKVEEGKEYIIVDTANGKALTDELNTNRKAYVDVSVESGSVLLPKESGAKAVFKGVTDSKLKTGEYYLRASDYDGLVLENTNNKNVVSLDSSKLSVNGKKIYNSDSGWNYQGKVGSHPKQAHLYEKYVHSHGNWQYSASGNTLTATCGNEGCSATPYSVSLNINATGGEYKNETYSAEYGNGEAAAWKQVTGNNAPTIEYWVKDGAKLDAAPKDAGTYVAKATVDGKTAEKEFTITKADQVITATTPQNYTYGDTDKSIGASAKDGAELSYAVKSGDSATVDASTGALTFVESGETVITVSAAATKNYKAATKDVKVKVLKAVVTASFSEDVSNLVYTGDKIEPGVVVKAGSSAIGEGNYTVVYSDQINAGENTAKATITLTEDGYKKYAFKPESTLKQSADLKYTIKKAVAVADFKDGSDEGIVYDGTEKTPEIEVLSDGETVTADQYTVIYSKNRNAGKALVTIVPGNNYMFEDAEVAQLLFDIARANVTVTAKDQTKNCTESDPEFTADVEGLVDGEELRFGYTFTREEGESAGTYKISPVGLPTQGNYAVTFVDGTLTIEHKFDHLELGNKDGKVFKDTLVAVCKCGEELAAVAVCPEPKHLKDGKPATIDFAYSDEAAWNDLGLGEPILTYFNDGKQLVGAPTEVGKYTVVMSFEGYETTASADYQIVAPAVEDDDDVKTGDSSLLGLYAILALIAAAGGVYVIKRREN